jgi:hypothetical protein
VAFHSDDARWHDFMARLWKAFVSAERAPQAGAVLSVTESSRLDGGWDLHFNDKLKLISADPWQLANQGRYQMVDHALRRAEGLLIHAGVVTKGPHTLIIAGQSGSGKTTLCLDLHALGWRLLCDDLAMIDDGLVRRLPLPISIRDNDAWQEYGHTWSDLPWLPAPVAGFLLEAEPFLYDGPPPRPTQLLFAEFEEGRGLATDELSTAEAIALAGEFVARVDRDAVARLRELCLGVECVRLRHGGQGAAWLDQYVG